MPLGAGPAAALRRRPGAARAGVQRRRRDQRGRAHRRGDLTAASRPPAELGLRVEKVKSDGLEQADQQGATYLSLFSTFGTFTISAGILLIFLVFVMLAAERRGEMGTARAIGTQRRHLVQMFLFEGAAYDVLAAAVGAVLGLALSVGDGAADRRRAVRVRHRHDPLPADLDQPRGRVHARRAAHARGRDDRRLAGQPAQHRGGRAQPPPATATAAPAVALAAGGGARGCRRGARRLGVLVEERGGPAGRRLAGAGGPGAGDPVAGGQRTPRLHRGRHRRPGLEPAAVQRLQVAGARPPDGLRRVRARGAAARGGRHLGPRLQPAPDARRPDVGLRSLAARRTRAEDGDRGPAAQPVPHRRDRRAVHAGGVHPGDRRRDVGVVPGVARRRGDLRWRLRHHRADLAPEPDPGHAHRARLGPGHRGRRHHGVRRPVLRADGRTPGRPEGLRGLRRPRPRRPLPAHEHLRLRVPGRGLLLRPRRLGRAGHQPRARGRGRLLGAPTCQLGHRRRLRLPAARLLPRGPGASRPSPSTCGTPRPARRCG